MGINVSREGSAKVPANRPRTDATDLRTAWHEIVNLTGRTNKRLSAMIKDAVVRNVDGHTVTLVFAAAFHANAVAADPGPLLAAIREVFGGDWNLRCEVTQSRRRNPWVDRLERRFPGWTVIDAATDVSFHRWFAIRVDQKSAQIQVVRAVTPQGLSCRINNIKEKRS